MKWPTNILASWNLSKELPKLAVIGGLCFALGYCNNGKTIRTNTTITEYRDTAVTNLDSLLSLLNRSTRTVYRETYHTIVMDSGDTVSSDITYTEDSTDYPPDEEIIEAVENVRDEIADIEPFTPSRFGFQMDAILGPSLPGGTVIGALFRVWFDMVSIFAFPRLVIPDFSRSSVDVGVGYRLF